VCEYKSFKEFFQGLDTFVDDLAQCSLSENSTSLAAPPALL
jgi:hypothetical protein